MARDARLEPVTGDPGPNPREGERRPTRLIVISDLHLGGKPAMMSHPERLESFIDLLPGWLEPDERLELVVAGDFVDFLALPPYADFTPDPPEALAKLKSVTDGGSDFARIFDALGRHVTGRHRLTILVGNHDVEMTLPALQDALLRRIGASPQDVRFIDDGRAYRVGGALVEHGNAYDGANANDWEGLRHLASAQSRNRETEMEVSASPGSQLVNRVVNEFKDRYPFVNLIQPEGELVAMLLLAFEPRLGLDFPSIGRLLRGKHLAARPPKRGKRPIAATGTARPFDPELLDAFGEDYRTLVRGAQGPQNVGATTEWFRSWITPRDDSLSEFLRRGLHVPEKRLKQIRVGFEKLLRDDQSDNLEGPAQQYGEEAERMLSTISGLDVVVMGHTHLPRCKVYREGTYINSGTWTDRFRIPSAVLKDETGQELEMFLSKLLLSPGDIPVLPPTFADLSIATSGQVTRAELRIFPDPSR